MHGSIFSEFRRYVETKASAGDWSAITSAASAHESHDPLRDYPDEELNALLAASVRRFDTTAAALLHDFGIFIAPALLKMFWGAIRPEWRALDVIEHTDDTIHSIVRLETPASRPPYLMARRTGPAEVEVIYNSPRRLCDLAKGIATGVAKEYNETISIEETECMHTGAERCVLMMREEAGTE